MIDFYSQKFVRITNLYQPQLNYGAMFANAFFIFFRNLLSSIFCLPSSVFFFLFASVLCLPSSVFSQSVGIFGSTNLGVNNTGAFGAASSVFDISSTTGGLLIPRMTTAQRDAFTIVTPPVNGLMIFNTSTGQFNFFDGGAWDVILDASSQPWSRTAPNVFLSTGTDNVGIGTTTPNAKLEVAGNIRMPNSEIIFSVNDNVRIYGSTSEFFAFYTNNFERMRIDPVGNVGIGTSAPISKLNVEGVGSSTEIFRVSNDLNATKDSTMVFNSTGNVGIGTTSPSSRFTIYTGSNISQSYLRITGTSDIIDINADNSSNTRGFFNIRHSYFASSFPTGDWPYIRLGVRPISTSSIGITIWGLTGQTGDLFQVRSAGGPGGGDLFVVAGNGNIGIGTTTPISLLNTEGAGMIGEVFRVSNDKDATKDSTIVFASAGYVGIGTTTPAEMLDVTGRLRIGANAAPGVTTDKLYNVGGNIFWNGLQLNTSGSSAWSRTAPYTYLTTGTDNVGIGTSVPTDRLEIQATFPTFRLNLTDNAQYSSIRFSENGTINGAIGQWGSLYAFDANLRNDVSIINQTAGASAGDINFHLLGNLATPSMIIKSSGNVGIGTTGPLSRLHVQGTTTSDSYLRVDGPAATLQSVFGVNEASTLGFAGTLSNHKFELRTNNIDRITILNDGNVGVGTSIPSSKLNIEGLGSAFEMFRVSNDINATKDSIMVFTSAGYAGIGTTAPVGELQVVTSKTNNLRGITSSQYNNDIQAPIISFIKGRGTPTSPLTVANGDYSGVFNFLNYDGSSNLTTATFGSKINGAVSPGNAPTELFFATSGGPSDTDPYTNGNVRMIISPGGNVGIGTTLPLATLDVTKDGGTVLFPRKSTTADPAGAANGMIYYNAFDNKFRAYQSGSWIDLIPGGGSPAPWSRTAPNVFLTTGTDKVGIGTGSPTAKLEVADGIFFKAKLNRSDAGASFKSEFAFAKQGTDRFSIGIDNGETGVQEFYIYDNISNITRLHINSSGNVGIGTTSSSSKLNVEGAASASEMFRVSNDINATKDSVMVITSAGNVGIGTTSPITNLHIASNTMGTTIALQIANDAGMQGGLALLRNRGTMAAPTAVLLNDALGGVNFIGYDGAAFGPNGPNAAIESFASQNFSGIATGANLAFFTTLNGTISSSERMRIENNGNVGIGTTAPGQKLTVAGTIETTSGGVKFPDASIQTTAATGGILMGKSVFTVAGAGTWTKPAGCSFVVVEAIGGGGGGGGTAASGSGTGAVGAGGGGGGYAMMRIDASTLSASESVSVGGGGAGGASGGGAGSIGGNSTFGTTIKVQANGGAGGGGTSPASTYPFANGGVGGSGITGDLLMKGQGGGIALGNNGVAIFSGFGGNAAKGGGGAAGAISGVIGSAAGISGGNYGGGGSGAWSYGISGGAQSGGSGAVGMVIIWEYK